MRRPQASFEAQPRSARLLAPRWASAPTTDLTKRRILRVDRVVRPYKEYEKPRGSGEKSPRFPFYAGAGRCGHRPLQTASEKRNILPFRVVGVDAYIDPQEMAGLLRFSGETVLVFYSTP